MKKICFVTTIYLTYKCFLEKFCDYLNETGEYDISLICADEIGVKEKIPNYIHFYPVSMKRGINISGFFAIKEIEKIFQKEKFDIVQYSTPNAAFYASIAARKANIPVRLYCQWGIRYMGFEGFKRVIFKKIEKIVCDNSTYIEVESNGIRDFSISEKLYFQNNSCVIWNGSACGVDFSKFDIRKKEIWRKQIRKEYEISDDTIVFSFAARLTADKGINELLEAFFNLEKKYSNIKLFVMGGMDDDNSINTLLFDKAKNSDNVILTGNVKDIERYYAASDVFVSPSYREGFGLVVIEAESMGLPAIVSNVPGQIDAIKENYTGFSCIVKDSYSLQIKMEKFIIDNQLRNQLSFQAYEYVKLNYDQKILFEKLKANKDFLMFGGK